MNVTQLKALCARFPGATSELYGHPSNVLVFSVGGKQFAYFKTSEPEKWRFSIRVTSERFVELTEVHGIKPARYMGRFHWVTIVSPSCVPPAYLRELIEWSYTKAMSSLSKARQSKAIGAG
jgi:predicted DNA-binding protein (MmcQ/YjbR family)